MWTLDPVSEVYFTNIILALMWKKNSVLQICALIIYFLIYSVYTTFVIRSCFSVLKSYVEHVEKDPGIKITPF